MGADGDSRAGGRAATESSAGPALGHRPALDGIRGVAIALVVLVHEFGEPNGFLGVDLFFVLSGFLITTLLFEEKARTGAVSLRGFYVRRARRLLPALAVMLALYVAMTVAFDAMADDWANLRTTAIGVAATCGLAMNLLLERQQDLSQVVGAGLVPLWSLAAEEQFYLLWPAVLFFLLRGRRAPALILLCVAFILIAARNLQLAATANSYRMQFGPDTRSGGIVIGCAVGVLYTSVARDQLLRWVKLLAPVACLYAWWLIAQPPLARLFQGPLIAFWVCAAIIIVRACDDRSYLGRMFAIWPLVALGEISYSLYIWHEVVSYTVFRLDEVNPTTQLKVAAIVTSIAVAAASHRIVERRFIRRRASPEKSPPMRMRELAIVSALDSR